MIRMASASLQEVYAWLVAKLALLLNAFVSTTTSSSPSILTYVLAFLLSAMAVAMGMRWTRHSSGRNVKNVSKDASNSPSSTKPLLLPNTTGDQNRQNAVDSTTADTVVENTSQPAATATAVISRDDNDDLLGSTASPDDLLRTTARYDAVTRECRYRDGSPARVVPDDCEYIVPLHYLELHRDKTKARQAYRETQEWRIRESVWNVLSRPVTGYPYGKFPLALHGFCRQGQPVLYEFAGEIHKDVLLSHDTTVETLVTSFVFLLEYLGSTQHCQPRDGATRLEGSSGWNFTYVLNVKGADRSQLSGDLFRLKSTVLSILYQHYPLNLKRLVLVNSPGWLAMVLTRMCPSGSYFELVFKTESQTLDYLRQHIDDDQIPPELGGSSPFSFRHHPAELAFRDFYLDAGQKKKATKRFSLLRKSLASFRHSITRSTLAVVEDAPTTSATGRLLRSKQRRLPRFLRLGRAGRTREKRIESAQYNKNVFANGTS